MGAILKAIFGGIGLTDLIKYAIKFAVFIAIIGLVQAFVNLLISHIPALHLTGCIAHYASAWGFIDGFRLLISIVIYGFLFKFGISLMSRFFDG